MKSHSVNYYISIVSVTGMLLLSVIGLNMFFELREIENSFKQSHLESASNELQRGIDVIVVKANELAAKLMEWDETSQQISNPTYYRFWRQRRVHAVQFIPDYVKAIEIYDSDGSALLAPRAGLLPDKVPEQKIFFTFDKQHPWLSVFKPIMQQQNSKKIFGFVGLKVDALPALLELNNFSHLDSSSISFKLPQSAPIPVEKFVGFFDSKELHYHEMDELKTVIYETFAYIVALVIVLLLALYGVIMIFFAKPLSRLNSYIESIKQVPVNSNFAITKINFNVSELNNFTKSLQDYQTRLSLAQQNLQSLNSELEQRVNDRTEELQIMNQELEAFSYSVSHDLRAPLRSIDGFSQALLEDYSENLDEVGKDYLCRVRNNSQYMATLIDHMLNLARISRVELQKSDVDLSELAKKVMQQLKEQQPDHIVDVAVEDNIKVYGDKHLLAVLMSNLLANSWKYTSRSKEPKIEFGQMNRDDERVFFVRDNGAGFDMRYADKLFEVFQRLHGKEFEGTGIGLATVSRIVKRHEGRIWANAELGKGACFYFTLGK